jgi:hypothetical protein
MIKRRFIGFVLSVLTFRKLKVTKDDLKRMEFKTSTKRMGISFNEKIRNAFRKRWLKKR